MGWAWSLAGEVKYRGGEYENKRAEVGGKKGGGVFLKNIT